MLTHDQSGGASGQQREYEVIYPDGTRGTMTEDEWRNRDTSLGIRRVGESDEPAEAEAIDDVTPTNASE